MNVFDVKPEILMEKFGEEVKAKKVKVPKLKKDDPDYKEKQKEKKRQLKLEKEQEAEKEAEANKEKDKRTIFVGNIPVDTRKEKLKKLFSECGTIESIRFRSIPIESVKVPRQLAAKGKLVKQGNEMHAYIVFKEVSSAVSALSMNNVAFEGKLLRVDSSRPKKASSKTSVFLGNLDRHITSDEIRGHFQHCGEIVNIRIVRDKETRLGKGIGYVEFTEKAGVVEALRLKGTILNERELRVERIVKGEERPKKEVKPMPMGVARRMREKKRKMRKKKRV